jgi:hypothetical protein
VAGGVAGVAGCVSRRVAFAVAGDLGTSRGGIEVQVQTAEMTYRLTSTMSTTTHIFTDLNYEYNNTHID